MTNIYRQCHENNYENRPNRDANICSLHGLRSNLSLYYTRVLHHNSGLYHSPHAGIVYDRTSCC